MIDTSVTYMGLSLKNPIIAGSCGLTNSIENLKKIESCGAAAVVLKSIFEEEILNQSEFELQEIQGNPMMYSQMSETLDYIDTFVSQKTIENYLHLITQAKKELLIPIIASINCISASKWITYAKRIQDAGADALELNIFIESSNNIQTQIKEIVQSVTSYVTIPVSVKISSSYNDLQDVIIETSKLPCKGIVLFNRFYSPDINLDTFEIISSNPYSCDKDYTKPLQWIAKCSSQVSCDLAASTGIHTGEAVIKQILAGASAVQVASALYIHGIDYISTLVNEVETWMEQKGYNYISQFKGKCTITNKNIEAFNRIQFMKYFSNIS